MEGVSGFAPDARWVRPESLHVTLKFIGEKPADSAEKIEAALSKVRATAINITFRGIGFFPTAKSARVFWVAIDAGPELSDLAGAVDRAVSTMGIPREERSFSPHLTLARGGSGSGAPRREKTDKPNRSFQKLQEKMAAMPPPEFGTMTAHEFFLYESQIMRGGARYTKIARFELS